MKKGMVFLILLAVGLICYANVLRGDFFQDDFALVLENEFLRSWSDVPRFFTDNVFRGGGYLSNLYRPVSLFVYFVLFQIFELQVVAYHSFNLLVHIVNAFLVFCLFRKLKFVEGGSLLAALLFLVHPAQAESVSYIAGLPDVLSSFFVIAGLVVLAGSSRKWDQVGVVMLFVLGLFSKESALVLLPLAIVISVYQKKWRQKVWGLAGLLIVAVFYLVLKFTVFNFDISAGLNAADNIYTEQLGFRLVYFVNTIWDYVVILVWPVTLYFERVFDFAGGTYLSVLSWKSLFGVFVIVFGGVLAWREPIIRLVYLWFFAALIPYMGIVPVNAPYKEHWLYIPLIGVLFLVAAGYEKFKEKRKVFMAVCVLIMVLFSGRVIMRNFEWADPVKFFENEITLARIDYRMYFGLGEYYFHNGDYEKAFLNLDTALKERRLSCDSCSYYLARLKFETGEEEMAFSYVEGCLRQDPNYLPMYVYLDATPQIERIDNKEWLSSEDVAEFLAGER